MAAEEPWNVASIALADGPAGLRLKKEYQVENGRIVPTDFLSALEGGFFAASKEKRGTSYHQYCTAIPVGTLLAQTWNLDLVRELGEMIRETRWNCSVHSLAGTGYEHSQKSAVRKKL